MCVWHRGHCQGTPLSSRLGPSHPSQCIPSFVRIYRNYVIGDFAFCTLFAVLASSAAVDPAARAQVCEHVSRQPDLLRDVIDLGLTLENCEQWFERGLMAFMAILLVRTVVRVCALASPRPRVSPRLQIHFIIALSRLYSRLASGYRSSPSCMRDPAPLERIYLLPHPPPDRHEKGAPSNEAPTKSPIYAPVPLARIPAHMAHQLRATATEAWVSRGPLPCHALTRVSSYDTDHPLYPVPTSPSVGSIHLKDETC